MYAIFSLIIFSLIIPQNYFARQLPCSFNYDTKFGYTCRVVNFSTTHKHVNLTGIIGDHRFYVGDKFLRKNVDVYRVTFYNLSLAYLPINLTIHFTNLRTLQVKNCGMKALTRSSDIFTLRRLYLGFNQIKNIPKTYFWNFCRLEVLSLANNRISTIHSMAFRDLINLKQLSLNGNHLKSIDELLFVNCVNIEVVDLDNNHLRYINGNLFANSIQLKKIFIRKNKLVSIESEFIEIPNSTLSIVALNKNPCLDFAFPDDGTLDLMRKMINKYCQYTDEHTTTTLRSTTTKPRKKPKYKSPPILHYENCTWHILKNYTHIYKSHF